MIFPDQGNILNTFDIFGTGYVFIEILFGKGAGTGHIDPVRDDPVVIGDKYELLAAMYYLGFTQFIDHLRPDVYDQEPDSLHGRGIADEPDEGQRI